MTENERAIIEEKLAESRRLGKEADQAADKAIEGLKRAARSGRYGVAVPGQYVSLDAPASRAAS